MYRTAPEDFALSLGERQIDQFRRAVRRRVNESATDADGRLEPGTDQRHEFAEW